MRNGYYNHICDEIIERYDERAIEHEESDGYLFIRINRRFPTVYKIDGQLGTVHCYVELGGAHDGEDAFQAEIYEIANELNITIARDLGLAHCVHVVGRRLHLSDIRPLPDGRTAYRLLEAQARDLCGLAGELIDRLKHAFARARPQAVTLPAGLRI